MEEWRDVVGYEGLYEVSNMGNIRRDGCIRRLKINSHTGYHDIDLYNKTICQWTSAHRLVALAFIPNPDNKPEVDHINRIRTDNRVENLRWATYRENRENRKIKDAGVIGKQYIMKSASDTFRVHIRRSTGDFQKCFKTIEEAITARDEFLTGK